MDPKLHTFLTLCQTMNYRMAAERLHLSQSAVTKQIQALEQSPQTKLFTYDGHTLHKTENCLLLERYAISQQYQFEELQLAIADKKRLKLRIGATKTIGDYVLIDAIKDYLSDPHHEISLVVDNTKHLLQMLDENQLDFAVIEGTFSKTKYDSYLLRMEPFVGICAKSSPLCGKQVAIEDLLWETIIVREEGSGTRRIFEERLTASGYELSDFYREVSIISFVSIKALVASGSGISFLFKSVVENECNIGTFTVDTITDPPSVPCGLYTQHQCQKLCGAVSGMQYGISYTKQSPTVETVGDSQLDIKVYPNVLPFVNSAFIAHAVQIRFRIFACHKECRKQQVISVLGQVSTPFFGALKFDFCISESVNKIIVLLS